MDKKGFRANLSEGDKEIQEEGMDESVVKSLNLNFNSSIIHHKEGQNDSNLLHPRNRLASLSLHDRSSLLGRNKNLGSQVGEDKD